MERIKVDTTVLREKSKVFETSAGVYAKGGSELLSLVAGLPSYDGQLSGPARATALEVNRKCQELHDCYLSDAQSLVKTAQAFEDVDGQTITVLNDNLAYIQEAPLIQKGDKSPGLAMMVPPEDSGDQGITITTYTRTEWDGSITVITVEEQQLPDGTVITKYTQTNTKVFSDIEVSLWDTYDVIRDALIDMLAIYVFSGLSIVKVALTTLGLTGLSKIANDFLKFTSHDLPAIAAGDTRIITTTGVIITKPDGSTTATWESTIQLFDKDGKLKGTIEGTYTK